MIQIEKLSKEFRQDGKRVVALDGIDLEVPHGEICVLLGPSGWQSSPAFHWASPPHKTAASRASCSTSPASS